MSKLPSMPLFTDVFISDTVHLTNEEIGIYIKLLCFAWTKNNGGIVNDANVYFRVCGAYSKREQDLVTKIINEFFYLRNDKLYNARLKKEWDYTADLVDKRRNAGILGQQRRQQIANKLSTPKPKPTSIPKYLFTRFWDSIDNKIGKGQAEKTFNKGGLLEDFENLEEAIPKIAELYNKHCLEKKEYAQHPSTWLNAKGYLDKPMETGTKHEDYGLPPQKKAENYVNFVKKKVHTTFIDDSMVREMKAKGLITEQEMKDYGVGT
tara:strand:- start:876 stop:1667 length:792 start_codon:yes stop_codon:yes gene_type:complete